MRAAISARIPLLEEWFRYSEVEPLYRVAMVTRDFGTAIYI